MGAILIFQAGQVGVLHNNIAKYLNGKSLDSEYDGYASCPLVTGYDSCIMAEFDYDLQPKETFPFRQVFIFYSIEFLLPKQYVQLTIILIRFYLGLRAIFNVFSKARYFPPCVLASHAQRLLERSGTIPEDVFRF